MTLMISKSKLINYTYKAGLFLLVGSPVVVLAAQNQAPKEKAEEIDYGRIEYFQAMEQKEEDLLEEKSHLFELEKIETANAKRLKEKEEKERQEQLEKEIRAKQALEEAEKQKEIKRQEEVARQEVEKQKATEVEQAEKEAVETVAAEEPEAPPVEVSSNSSGQFLGDFSATSYALGDGLTPNTFTRDGTDVSSGMHGPDGHRIIAVDPNVIPLGTVVRVELPNGESFIATARDTGGAINGYKIDIFVGRDISSANSFGRQSGIKVYKL